MSRSNFSLSFIDECNLLDKNYTGAKNELTMIFCSEVKYCLGMHDDWAKVRRRWGAKLKAHLRVHFSYDVAYGRKLLLVFNRGNMIAQDYKQEEVVTHNLPWKISCFSQVKPTFRYCWSKIVKYTPNFTGLDSILITCIRL